MILLLWRKISRKLFAPAAKNAKLIASPAELGTAIGAVLKPDVAMAPATPEVGFIHRKLPDADIYFLANTGDQPHAFEATFRTARTGVEWWDPFIGKFTGAGVEPHAVHFISRHMNQRCWSSLIMPNPYQCSGLTPFTPIDLTHDWKVTFDKTRRERNHAEPCTRGQTSSAEDTTLAPRLTTLRSRFPETLQMPARAARFWRGHAGAA